MAKTRDYMDYLDEKVEIAPANSQEEYQAASTIADLMQDHGLDPHIEEFEAYSWSKLLPAVVVIAMFVCLVVTGVTQGIPHVITLILAIAGVAALLVSHFLRNLFETIGPTKRSQNVVAVHRASGDKVVKGARPIVIVAHYDTPRVSLLRKGALARMQSSLWGASIACTIVVAVSLFMQVLVFLPSAILTFAWVVGIIAALPLLFLAVVTIIDNFGACTLGANDNKSSIAAMLSIMNKVCPSDDRVDGIYEDEAPSRRRESDPAPQPPAPVRREVVEDVVGVRHGRDILRALNILPAGCEIVYETPKVKIIEEVEEEFDLEEQTDAAATPDLGEWDAEDQTDEAYDFDDSYDDEYSDDTEDDYEESYEDDYEDESYYGEDASDEDVADESEEDDVAIEQDQADESDESEELGSEPRQNAVRSSRLHRTLPLVEDSQEYDEDDEYEDEYDEEYDEEYEYTDDESDYDEYDEDAGYDESDEDDEGDHPSIGDRIKGIWAIICAFFVGVAAKIKGLFSKKKKESEEEWENDDLLEDDEDGSISDEEDEAYDYEESYDDVESYEDDYAYEEEYEEEYVEDDVPDTEYSEDEYPQDDQDYDYYEEERYGYADVEAYDDQYEDEYDDQYEDEYDDQYDEQDEGYISDEDNRSAFEGQVTPEPEPEPEPEQTVAYEDEADGYYEDYEDYEEDVIAQGGYERAPIAPAQQAEPEAAYDDTDTEYYEDDYYEDDELYDDEFAVLEEEYQEGQSTYDDQYDDEPVQEDEYYGEGGEDDPYSESYEGEYDDEYVEGEDVAEDEGEPAKQSLGTRIMNVFRKIRGQSDEDEPYMGDEYADEGDYLEDDSYEGSESGYDEGEYGYEEYESTSVDESDDYDESEYVDEGYVDDEGYEEDEYGQYDEYDSYADREARMHPADPNELHFDREEDYDIVPRDTTGLDTISETYDLIPQEPTDSQRREPPASIEDPNWGVSTYQPTPPARNFARRAALFDLPDPSTRELDPLASDEYDDYDSYDEYEDEYSSSEGDAYQDSSTASYEDYYEEYDDPSLDDIMKQSRDFTNQESARRAASSEELSRRNNDDQGGQSRSFWKGGASVRADLRDSDEPLIIDEADLQDAILEMGDDFLQGHDVWFVATGASSLEHAGIKAFLDEHRRDIRGSFLINLEAIGAGSLSLLVSEGLHAPRRADRRLVRMLKDIAGDLHIDLGQSILNWDETDAATTMRSRIRSVTITGLDENGLPALSRTMDDVPQNVNPDTVSSVVRLVTELIRRS